MADSSKPATPPVNPAPQAQPVEPVAQVPTPVELKYGMPVKQYNGLSHAEKRRLQINDATSDLRNQVTPEDIADFQLLSNTPAQIITAMTGMPTSVLQERANALNVTLKGSLAGSVNL